MLDSLAKRYGKLPTEVLRKGDSFDISVMDVALTYEKYQRDKESGNIDTSMYDMDALKQAADRAKEDHENKQQSISKKNETTEKSS